MLLLHQARETLLLWVPVHSCPEPPGMACMACLLQLPRMKTQAIVAKSMIIMIITVISLAQKLSIQ